LSSIAAAAKYLTMRPPCSSASVKRAKILPAPPLHPIFLDDVTRHSKSREEMKLGIKNFKPRETIFESRMNNANRNPEVFQMMKKKRKLHDNKVKQTTVEGDPYSDVLYGTTGEDYKEGEGREEDEENDHIDEDLDEEEVTTTKKPPKKKQRSIVDEKFFISNVPSKNPYREKGLSVKEQPRNAEFNAEVMDMIPDEREDVRANRNVLRWDRKKMKYQWINPRYADGMKDSKEASKTEDGKQDGRKDTRDKNYYQQWQKLTHGRIQHEGEYEKSMPVSKVNRFSSKAKAPRSEIRDPAQIRKYRMKAEIEEKKAKAGRRKKLFKSGKGGTSGGSKGRPQRNKRH